ncbi:MAG: glycosyltransferase family protein [Candidatus Curtissbacteria bacterium]|nr:glycosyltransferase family protein [Candidatus Curtissbacteria bacterium]
MVRGRTDNIQSVCAIIQARFDSERLPGKILAELAGKPLLWHICNRLKYSKRIKHIIVSIPRSKDNDILEKFAKEEQLQCFRGNKKNVLSRFYNTAKKFDCGIIVRITADNPLIDPQIIDVCIREFIRGKVDYLSTTDHVTRSLPIGLDVEVFSSNALFKAYRAAKTSYEKEHVTPYMWFNRNREFIIGKTPKLDPNYYRNYRLTVDWEKDLLLMRKIYDNFFRENAIVDVKKVLRYLDQNQELAMLNIKLEQQSWKVLRKW